MIIVNLKQPSARPPPTRLSFCPRPALVGLKRNNTITMMMMMMVMVSIVIMIMLSPIELSWFRAQALKCQMYFSSNVSTFVVNLPTNAWCWMFTMTLRAEPALYKRRQFHRGGSLKSLLTSVSSAWIYRLTIHNLISTKKPYENSKLKWNVCFWSIVKKHAK